MPRWQAIYHLRPPGPTIAAIEIYPSTEAPRRPPPYRGRAHLTGGPEDFTHTGWWVQLGHAELAGAGGYLDVHQDLGQAPVLNARILRQLRAGRAIREALWMLRDARMAEWVVADWPEREWTELVDQARRRLAEGSLRPHARSRLQRAAAAAEYADAVEAGDPRPVATVAARLGLRPTQIRDLIYKARHNDGYLSPAGQGRAGGQLTDKGKAILKEA